MCSCATTQLKKPLQAPYDVPYCVLRRTDKTFTIEKNGKEFTINIDRVKPAFFENSHQSSAPTTASPPVTAPSSMQSVLNLLHRVRPHHQIPLHHLM
ncbi:hypothetical protein AVEN_146198-1 [Araneus ventricosus]|uniref:Uncharacterized protein n=1 Tax=Araneus ventricosus TaxID=182803 RepID=A0A4Y2CK54_ARAVE|nr:hypothetical protein AVEN_146198-1 [Araneus ventricosus]